MESRLPIQSGFEPRCEPIKCGPVGTCGVLGRHHPRAELSHDSFPGHDIFFEMGQILCIEFEVPGLASLVMTGGAILIDNALSLLWRERSYGRTSLASTRGYTQRERTGAN